MYPVALPNRVAVVTAPPVSAAAKAVAQVPAQAGSGQPSPAGRSPPEVVHTHRTTKGEATGFRPFSFSGEGITA
ncbi:hypothetical protein ACGFIK_19385 [Micromonospora sp. NPDC048871]|uniref:hypothetical protein n=1 Tax=unclassified Micromonospora TaxID=2617518 RepID=UPI002E1277EF|nr:hypothetical protein OIE53_06115 [Micromonospora sp. NBC_01739]